ncbi:MAG: hypothetical protein OXG85_03320 [Chloroflexi bacterium]|nr:hypothetical protein [Chloroflexota bacterium]
MQEQEEQPQEKKKRNCMTKYDRMKFRILVFIAIVLVTQAVLSVGSFLHLKATWDKMFPEEPEYAHCICQETAVFYCGPNIE